MLFQLKPKAFAQPPYEHGKLYAGRGTCAGTVIFTIRGKDHVEDNACVDAHFEQLQCQHDQTVSVLRDIERSGDSFVCEGCKRDFTAQEILNREGVK